MTRKKLDFGGRAFKSVFGYTFAHWRKQPWRIGTVVFLSLAGALADVLTPYFAGRLVNALATGAHAKAAAFDAALAAFGALIALGAAAAVLRYLMFLDIIALTLRMMSEIAGNAFHRVQRFSSDWHANSFAGSTVRKITRGMWAVDTMDDILLLGFDAQSVEVEKQVSRAKSRALVPVDKRVVFGNAEKICGRQFTKVGLAIGLFLLRSCERRLQHPFVADTRRAAVESQLLGVHRLHEFPRMMLCHLASAR